jgi:cytoskeletal protein RodZ
MILNRILSLGILFLLLLGLGNVSFAAEQTKTQAVVQPKVSTQVTPTVKVAPTTGKQGTTTTPINIQPQNIQPQQNVNVQPQAPIPTDTKGKVLYYLKNSWGAIVLVILVAALLFLYNQKEGKPSKRKNVA